MAYSGLGDCVTPRLSHPSPTTHQMFVTIAIVTITSTSASKLPLQPNVHHHHHHLGGCLQMPCDGAQLCTAPGSRTAAAGRGAGQGRRPDALLCQHGPVRQLPGRAAPALQALQRLQKVCILASGMHDQDLDQEPCACMAVGSCRLYGLGSRAQTLGPELLGWLMAEARPELPELA